MATLNIRLDDNLKNEAYKALAALDVTPTEAIRQYFQYIADNKKLPIKNIPVTDDELELLETVRHRLANPQTAIKVSLDDL
ncbi:bifunctional antitoxin/transcriptional repressor RelB [Pasteurellaceae bacterium 15-036681]|nr:bifunctional antitoxin/transcriptional repressor RelB [Pasteurellaceae bacterium 15-036681]